VATVMSKLVIYGTQDLHPDACKELSNIVLDSFNNQLNKYFDKERTKKYGKK
jgi:hypothetical protein